MLTAADTAFAIAAVRADEQELFSDPYAARFAALGAHASSGTQRFLSLPFFRDGIRLRTRFIDDTLRAALADGVRQIVLLGAGFDARAHRIAGGARYFEIDLADQLCRKREVLAREPWIADIVCDLTADYEVPLTRALADAGFEHSRTFVIWEGVTTYIGAAATDRTLRFLSTIATEVVFDVGAQFAFPSRSAFTFESHTGDALWRRYLPGDPHAGAATFQLVIARR
jgi:methyltransferase (TIGR00027 family)